MTRKLPIFLKNILTGDTIPTSLEADFSAKGGVNIRLDRSEKNAEYWVITDNEGEELDAFPDIDAEAQELKYIVTNLTGAWTYPQKIIKGEDDEYCLGFNYPQVKDDEDIDPVVIGYKVVAKVPIQYCGKDTDGKYKTISTEYASPNTLYKLNTEINSTDIIPCYMGTPIIEEKGADNGKTVYKVRVGKAPVNILARAATDDEVLLATVKVEENTSSNGGLGNLAELDDGAGSSYF